MGVSLNNVYVRILNRLRALVVFFLPPLSWGEAVGTVNFFRFRRRVNSETIAKFESAHDGETIFVFGAGPSVNSTNLDLAKGYPVIFCNAAVSLAGEFNASPKYWIMSSGMRMNAFRAKPRGQVSTSFRCIGAWPSWIKRNSISGQDVVLPIPVKRGLFRVVDDQTCNFSDDLSQHICHGGGGSVIFMAIQLAAYMGARKIVLLGADFGVQEGQGTHFVDFERPNPTAWLNGEYDRKVRKALVRYLEITDSKGILLVNGSPTTADDVLPRTKEFVR